MKTLRLLLFFSLICQASFLQAQYTWLKPEYSFKDLPQGISQNSVNEILQDQQGLMWIGTDDGLNRFDGYRFDVYRYDPDNQFSISNSLIRAMAVDRHGELWVGTERGGLNLFKDSLNGFLIFDHAMPDGSLLSRSAIYDLMVDQNDLMWIATNNGITFFDIESKGFVPVNKVNPDLSFNGFRIWDILETADKRVWIGTEGKGLWVYDPQRSTIDHFSKSQTEGGLMSDHVRAIYQDSDANIWVGTSDGLYSYDSRQNNFRSFDRPELHQAGLGNSDIWALAETGRGELVIGTDGGGLNIKDADVFLPYLPQDNQFESINDNVIRELFRDRNHNLWIGTFRGGVNLLTERNNNFYVFKKGPQNKLKNNSILDIALSDNNNLWVGTDGGGLQLLDLATGEFSSPRVKTSWRNSDRIILSVLQDHEGSVWLGTYQGGIKYLSSDGNKHYHYTEQPNGLINNSILELFQDSRDRVWIGTNGGINVWDPLSRSIERVDTRSSSSIIDNQNSVRAIHEDGVGNLWLGVMGGLKKVNGTTREVTSYFFEGDKKNYLTNAIHQDSSGDFWLGTYGGGLVLFNTEEGVRGTWRTSDGLPSDAIYSILSDRLGRLWLSTGKGISRFDPGQGIFNNYVAHDDNVGGQYNRGAFYEDEAGCFWFGGVNGLVIFHPDSVTEDEFVPDVVFTDLKIFNQSIIPEEGSALTQPINLADKIVLDHSQSVFTLEFAGLDFAYSDRINYAYYLEGFDQEWQLVGNARNATYTNLDPGNYTFHVKASSNDGLWGEERRTILITIMPPWWRTWWAYLAYLVIIVFLLFLARQFIVFRERLKTNLKLEHMELTHLQEMDHLRSKFFANISHELRTPLTLILDPLRLMYDREPHPKAQKQLKTMIRNAQRLLRLINQLLDLSKLEAGNMDLEKKKTEITSWFQQLLPAFSSYAEQHKITFRSELPKENIWAEFDQDKIEKVITNLLSNSLKFTADGGEIKVAVKLASNEEKISKELDQDEGWIAIEVTDTGIGIPQSKIQHIFDRFYQVDGAHHREREGTGIGLSLTKELVELHEGKIIIKSKEGRGTQAFVYLPCSVEGSERVKEKKEHTIRTDIYSKLESTVSRGSYGLATVKAGQSAPLVLIVEDNPDVASYISDQLGNEYRVKEARNGKEGLELAIEVLPDVIISDVMMPVMDGIEMTKELKSDQRSSHIPIVLLTAKAEEDDIFAGIHEGADDYVVKPFDSKLLKARIKNILKSRELLRDRFADHKVISLEPKEVTATPVDEMFLKKALQSVEENISHSDFTVEDFGNEVGLSRMQLYRKLKALTDQSPNEFIRTVRLKRAAQLIHLDQLTISQITYEVGFNDLQYFRDCFKKHFGVNPSDYGSLDPEDRQRLVNKD